MNKDTEKDYNKYCRVSDCESYQEDLITCKDGTYICSEHARDIEAEFEDMAMAEMRSMGLPEDEAESMLSDFTFTI